MKVKLSLLRKLTREELIRYIGGLLGEAPKKPGLVDGEADSRSKEAKADGEEDKGKKKAKDQEAPDAKKRGEPKGGKPLPTPKEPADDELEDEPEDDKDTAPEPGDGEDEEGDEEDAEDVTGGDIAKELEGKRIQSITMEPKSKIMPGAQEINIQFADIPDPLRILVNKSGNIKFYFKGLHNEL